MPFTLSHAAAALPFRRTRLIISAVVVGCFAPDLEYFLELSPHTGFGHSLPGVFAFDLPMGFALLWLFHRYAKEPLAACLPAGARDRVQVGPKSLSIHSISRLGMILLSILVGVATHILWDSFTHDRYWLFFHWDLLRERVTLPLFGPRPWYGIFQYISSALGIAIILIWFLHWYRNTAPVRSRPDRRFLNQDRIALAGAFAIAVAIALFRAVGSGVPDGVHGAQRFMTQGVVTCLAIFWLEVVIYGIVRNHTRSEVPVA